MMIIDQSRGMIEIVPARLSHLRALLPNLRAEEKTELAAIGGKPRHVLFGLWRETIDPRAAIMNGDVLAVWGDCMPPLHREASLWFFTSAAIERVPIGFMKIARAEIARMLEYRQVLRSSVHRSCARALRFYDKLGFTFVEGTMREGFVEIRISR